MFKTKIQRIQKTGFCIWVIVSVVIVIIVNCAFFPFSFPNSVLFVLLLPFILSFRMGMVGGRHIILFAGFSFVLSVCFFSAYRFCVCRCNIVQDFTQFIQNHSSCDGADRVGFHIFPSFVSSCTP